MRSLNIQGALPPLDTLAVIDAFAQAIASADLGTPEIMPDGAIHRFRLPTDRPGQRSGWYRLRLDGVPAGSFGSWKTGAVASWSWKPDKPLSLGERTEHRDRIARAQRQRQADQEHQYREAATRAAAIWEGCAPAPTGHAYLVRKEIQPHGARLDRRGWLVIPIGDGGQLTTLQFIAPEGSKRFLSGGRISGCWYRIEGATDGPILIGEGFATMATLRELTGCPAIVAFNAGNLLPVSQAIRRQHPHADIILCGDDDRWTEGNPGRTKARSAALAIGAKLLMPDFTGLDLSTRPTDWNDWRRLARASGRTTR